MTYYFPTTNISLSDICSRAGQTAPPYSLGALRGRTVYNKSNTAIILLANSSISMDSFKDITLSVPTTTKSISNYQYDDRHDDSYTLGDDASIWLGGVSYKKTWAPTWTYHCWGGWQNFSYQTNGTKIYSIKVAYISGCNTGGTNTGGKIDYQSISITTSNPAVTYSLNATNGVGEQTVTITDGCSSFHISIVVDGASALYSGRINFTSPNYNP
jgi:hypothetical protein